MLVRVQASTTRVEPTRVLLPASRCREEHNEELQRGLDDAGSSTRSQELEESSKIQRGEDDAGWCRSSQPASRREGTEESRGTEPRGIDYPRAWRESSFDGLTRDEGRGFHYPCAWRRRSTTIRRGWCDAGYAQSLQPESIFILSRILMFLRAF